MVTSSITPTNEHQRGCSAGRYHVPASRCPDAHHDDARRCRIARSQRKYRRERQCGKPAAIEATAIQSIRLVSTMKRSTEGHANSMTRSNPGATKENVLLVKRVAFLALRRKSRRTEPRGSRRSAPRAAIRRNREAADQAVLTDDHAGRKQSTIAHERGGQREPRRPSPDHPQPARRRNWHRR